MTKRILILLAFAFIIPFYLEAQSDDPVLFTVEGTDVHVSEFNYIYQKTNGEKANYSKQSVEEYLDLYVKFKLKVQKAREMKLDTIPQLINELEGYRRQLADSYLIDKEVTEKLMKEVYERSKEDIDISQIFVKLAENADGPTEEAALKKIKEAQKRLGAGEAFDAVAREMSEGRSDAKTGGRIGYVSALFPNGFYALETAAYSMQAGTISDLIRTSAGYHLVKVHDRRAARGEIEAAHILIRLKGRSEEQAKKTIDSIYQVLQKENNFEALAQQFSEDKKSARNGGSIGFFGINKYEKTFENAAFALSNDNTYTEPIKTAAGWHIIKRISKKDLQAYNIEKGRLKRLIEKDRRYKEAQEAMLVRIKQEANFTEYKDAINAFMDTLPDTFTTFKWRASKEEEEGAVFKLGANTVSLSEFDQFLGKQQRDRLRLGRSLKDNRKVAERLYNKFVEESCMKYEEGRLEEKYPEFKSLMREYEEGIMLFEATKIEVWDKASQDTVGLEQFFGKIKGKYRWEDRAVVEEYKISSDYANMVTEVEAFAAKNDIEAVKTKFNTPERMIVLANEKTYEKSRNNTLKNMDWKVGAISNAKKKSPGKFFTFMKIKELLPPADKTLKEARGYIVADYQDELDKSWVDQLRKEYKVKINDKVLKDLIKN